MPRPTRIPPKLPPKTKPPTRIPPLPWLFASCGLGLVTTCVAIAYYNALQKPLPSPSQIASLDLLQVWKTKHALEVDDGRGYDEWLAGILRRRKKLCALAQGDVLESAAGTGVNLGYYDPKKVRSVTLVDVAPSFLEAAREKWVADKSFGVMRKSVRMRFLVGDLATQGVASALKPIQALEGEGDEGGDGLRRFDTVVQTMGLCSTRDPVELLRNLSRLVKEDGKILLLEHGASHYGWINKGLDHTAWDHAKKQGCWWNRDIYKIVEESGLEVEEIKRSNLGTTWWLILRPNKDLIELPTELKVDSKTAQKSSGLWPWNK